jgi:hypothetical protein
MIDIKQELQKIFDGKTITFTDSSNDGPIITINDKQYEAICATFKFPISYDPEIRGGLKIRYFDIPENNEIRIYVFNILFYDQRVADKYPELFN